MSSYKYYASFDTSRTYSSQVVNISGSVKASSCEEALEKSKLIVISNFDELYISLKDIDAEIIFSDYNETEDVVKEKIVEKIRVKKAPEFEIERNGHWE